MKPFRNRIIPLILLSCALLSIVGTGCAHTHVYTDKVILPTCTSIGYTIHTCPCGDVYYSDYQAEIPHEYADWVTVQEPTLVYGGEECRSCINCGKILTRDTECTSPLPKIRISEIIGSELKKIDYASAQHRFQCFVSIGEYSVTSGKPDYVLALCDGERNEYVLDLGWGQTSAYMLKGCAKDPTRLREETSAHFWNAILQANGGTVAYLPDGSFPVLLYLDDSYAGLYMLSCLPGSADDGVARTAFVQTDKSGGCLFTNEPTRCESTGTGFLFTGSPAPGTVITEHDKDVAWQSFLDFQTFVRESTDSDFTRHLDRYADVNELIDFFLFSELTYAADAAETELLWFTEDGKHWKADYRKLDSSIGISSNGTSVAVEQKLPSTDGDGHMLYHGSHRLWVRLTACFGDQVTQRYHKMRESLSAESMYAYFSALYATLHPDLFDLEKELFPSAAYNKDPSFLQTFLTTRFERMDTRSVPESAPGPES